MIQPSAQHETTPAPRPKVSVIIPTYNGAAWLDRVLAMLQAQTWQPDEIVVVDSGSTDATLVILQKYAVCLLQIQKEQFDHGGTRSMAIQQAEGELLVFLTQDAIPADSQALARLLQPFLENGAVAATYGRQLPNTDAHAISAHLRLFNYPEQGSVRCLRDKDRYGFKTIFISNSFAAYRREALAEAGNFPTKLLFGEDTYTVAKLLDLGYCVQYVSDATVYHSHNYSPWQDVKRYFDIGVFHASAWNVLGQYGTPTGAGKRFLCSEVRYLLMQRAYLLILQSVVRNGLKMAAYTLGRRYTLLPRRLAKSLSMHPLWWN